MPVISIVRGTLLAAAIAALTACSWSWAPGRRIRLRDAVPGDLLFFRIEGGMHVTIHVGDGRVVHAPAPGKDVRLAEIGARYWRERFHSAVRIVP